MTRSYPEWWRRSGRASRSRSVRKLSTSSIGCRRRPRETSNLPRPALGCAALRLQTKKTAAGFPAAVEDMYDVAMKARAWAGKVSGAGGGGFLMLMTDPENHYRLISAINEAGGRASAAKLTFEGAEGHMR